ncbi:hypothetical protein EJM73_09335 [Clostridium botulinum]|uniref:hypothetical protein n=1 Tax=Clostridium botulinum TaxID=1491 RepID=UPI001375EF60|nr:hypothetical protein [Clostridium botulinum]NCI19829.1 hypothetical protein [Clostridium botulinum]NCI35867.1 hypothetical protein [Clostridium botulinum]NCI71724.1 hypothetical protein [Clostridium botulinum]NDI38640.1 hypothetical protein [Clostridium botulinum]
MIASRELYLKVVNNGGTGNESYRINEDVTILMNNDCVLRGIIEEIYEKFFTISIISNKKEFIALKYEDIKKIANTEWLAGEDIRDN